MTDELANATRWALDYLVLQGIKVEGFPQEIHATPWSCVYRFSTSEGFIYLKKMPRSLAVESVIINILRQYTNSIPIILESNPQLDCFLMQDAGTPLRPYLTNNFQPAILLEAVHCYRDIQSAAINNVHTFLNAGVPDWRLEKLPAQYRNLILQTDVLTACGVTSDELIRLQQSATVFSALCEQLSLYQILETLDHCDFHVGNILINPDNKKLTIIDWGETVVTHPFFSLLMFLRKVKMFFSPTLKDGDFRIIQQACFGDADLQAIEIAKKIWPVYAALGYVRLMVSSPSPWFEQSGQSNRVRAYLQDYLRLTPA